MISMDIKGYLEQAATDLVTLRDFLRLGITLGRKAQIFLGHGTNDMAVEMVYLIRSALQLEPEEVDYLWDTRLTAADKQELLRVLSKRIVDRMPAAYILNQAMFAKMPFYVDERVLIPRSPIAELIEHHFEPWIRHEPRRILDLCTGSGVIAIACAYAFPHAKVDATDLSSEALAVAEINVKDHDMQARVELLQGDLFAPVAGRKYDVIVSNPPYIPKHTLDTVQPEFKYEPRMAFTDEADGLQIVHQILREADEYLTADGLLIVEVGWQVDAIMQAYPNVPFTWPEFENEGDGVFILEKKQLNKMKNY